MFETVTIVETPAGNGKHSVQGALASGESIDAREEASIGTKIAPACKDIAVDKNNT